MFRGLTVAAAVVALLLVGSCKKKPSAKEKPSAEAMDRASARTAPRAPARPGTARATAAKRAASLCAKGVRPDHPVDKDQYTLTVKIPAESPVGSTAQAVLEVVSKKGYHVNVKYPTELSLKAQTAGVALPKPKLEKEQAKVLTTEKLRFEVPVALKTPGRKVVSGELSFSVCTPKLCITEPDMCVAWEVTAK